MENIKIGIIGGSGIYDIEGVENVETVEVDTPFGKPSDKIIVGVLGGVKFAFLPRHGRGHKISPTELNFRANIYALKTLGVEKVLSITSTIVRIPCACLDLDGGRGRTTMGIEGGDRNIDDVTGLGIVRHTHCEHAGQYRFFPGVNFVLELTAWHGAGCGEGDRREGRKR